MRASPEDRGESFSSPSCMHENKQEHVMLRPEQPEMSSGPPESAGPLGMRPGVDSDHAEKPGRNAALVSLDDNSNTTSAAADNTPSGRESPERDTTSQHLAASPHDPGANRTELSLSSPGWEDLPATPSATPAYSAGISEPKFLDLASTAFAPVPPDAILPPLPKPVLVPRTSPGLNHPFARAWAPELENHAVTRADFVAFIDNLNIVCAPHAAGRILHVAAFGIGLAQNEYTDAVAGVLEGIAILSMVAVTHTRVKKYLARLNGAYFHPRRLHVKIVGTKKMLRILGLDKKTPLIAPLSEETLDLGAQERCLLYLSQWACQLDFNDIPPPRPQTTALAKLAQWEVTHRIKEADKKAKNSRKRAWKRFQKGKKLKEDGTEKARVKELSWIMVENLHKWEQRKAEKLAKKEEKKRSSTWRTITSRKGTFRSDTA